jgi:hypothetical protein
MDEQLNLYLAVGCSEYYTMVLNPWLQTGRMYGVDWMGLIGNKISLVYRD